MRFNTPHEMYETIAMAGIDLFCPEEELYAFLYSDDSIAVYWVSPDEAVKLQKMAAEANEYWGAFLGIGGRIYEFNDEERPDPINFCEEYFDREWIKCSDVG